MDNVNPWNCFPTSIHEVNMNISEHDQMLMLSYIETGVKDDTLHTLSYFRPLADSIQKVSEKILENGQYEFEKTEITNMWGNLLEKGQTHPPHTLK